MKDPIWFSPLNVLHHARLLSASLSTEEKRGKNYRKVIEANMAALMLTGLMTTEGKQYWMQIVDDSEGSPDVRTLRYSDTHSEKFDNMEQQDVEVVEYEQHSKESIPDFLAKTKFSSTKGYDEKTHILCYLGDGIKIQLPTEEDLRKQMLVIKSASPIALLASTSMQADRYRLILLNPDVRTIIEFNPIEELLKLSKKGYLGVLNLKRGSRRPMQKRPEERHYPFEKLGYIPDGKGKY